jgi:hypothetical protein
MPGRRLQHGAGDERHVNGAEAYEKNPPLITAGEQESRGLVEAHGGNASSAEAKNETRLRRLPLTEPNLMQTLNYVMKRAVNL